MTVPMTPEATYALREAHGFVSPIRPVEAGAAPWLCFAQRGKYEFFVHPTDANTYLEDGIVIDGKRLPCVLSATPFYPFIGAWQIVANDRDVNTGWVR